MPPKLLHTAIPQATFNLLCPPPKNFEPWLTLCHRCWFNCCAVVALDYISQKRRSNRLDCFALSITQSRTDPLQTVPQNSISNTRNSSCDNKHSILNEVVFIRKLFDCISLHHKCLYFSGHSLFSASRVVLYLVKTAHTFCDVFKFYTLYYIYVLYMFIVRCQLIIQVKNLKWDC